MAAIDFAPLSQVGTLVVAVPESPVEDLGEFAFQRGGQFGRVFPLADGIRGAAVASGCPADVFRAAGAAFDLEHPHAGIHDLVQELDRAEVFGRHDVFVVDVQLVAGFEVGHFIAAAADLEAGAAVGRGAACLEAEVAFAGNGHAERAVGEHFDAYEFTGGAFDPFADDGFVDRFDLEEIQFARQHDDVAPLGPEAQGFDVGDVELGGGVDFEADPAAVGDRGHVGGDHR